MDNASLPESVQPLIAAYLRALEPLQAHFYGIYLYGSIALGAFEEIASDVDVIVLTQGEWSEQELRQLADLHRRLLREQPMGRRLEVLYVPVENLGKSRRESSAAPYPGVYEGQFAISDYSDANGVTWWILKHKGICLLGVEREDLPFEYEWQQVLLTMRFNLDVYAVRRLKRGYIYLHPAAVEFMVSNLCRILSTIEDGEIVSKSASLKIWRARLPQRWRRLLDEVWRIRYRSSWFSLYHSPLHRLWETIAFIQYVRQRGGKALDVVLAQNAE